MKKSELIFTFLLVPLDFLMIVLAAISAYQLRFAEFTAGIRPVIFSLPFESYLAVVFYLATFWLIIFAFAGLYAINGFDRISNELYRVILASSTGFVAIIILMFFQRELFSSRFILLTGWLLSIFFVAGARVIIRKLQRYFYRQGVGIHQVAIIGNSLTTERMIKAFSANKALGYAIARKFKYFDAAAVEDLSALTRLHKLDEIIQADPNLSKADVLKIIDFCEENHLTFKYAADLLGTKILKTEVNMMAGIPLVEIKTTPLEGWGR
ncbi:hypothetical protein COU00_02315, partial [Candidatus Falkowbacteria bacterium CG10_big_fil_rev_8_21_14_0_10_43_11]